LSLSDITNRVIRWRRRFDSKAIWLTDSYVIQQNVAYLLSTRPANALTPLGLTSTRHTGNTCVCGNEPERAMFHTGNLVVCPIDALERRVQAITQLQW
jgi:hypothetical protein